MHPRPGSRDRLLLHCLPLGASFRRDNGAIPQPRILARRGLLVLLPQWPEQPLVYGWVIRLPERQAHLLAAQLHT